MYITVNNIKEKTEEKQLNFFETAVEEDLKREDDMQKAINSIKMKFGKNAMFKGMDLEDGATTLERNLQIGGHKSGNEK